MNSMFTYNILSFLLQKLDVDTTIADIRGRKMKALKVVAHAIRYLKDRVLAVTYLPAHLNQSVHNEILWVLTVPAIWDNRAKSFMRKAAHEVL